MPSPAASRQETNTVIVGAGQAGLATSYWLSQHGVEHRLLERRPALGGAWQDRWDSFYLNTPNFSLTCPARPMTGPSRTGSCPGTPSSAGSGTTRSDIAAPVELGTASPGSPPRMAGSRWKQTVARWAARNVVLASGAFQRPRIPPAAVGISAGRAAAAQPRLPQSRPAAGRCGAGGGDRAVGRADHRGPARRRPRRCTCPSRPAPRRPGGTAARTSSTGSCR